MKIIGITGGIGAGKSAVLDYLKERYGAYIIQADQVGHALMEPKGSCFLPVVKLLGKETLDTQGKIDRGKIAALVFPNPQLLAQLNEIIHPAVKQKIREHIAVQEQEGRSVFVIEAALLIEDHYEEICQEFWYIYAEEAVRRRRLKEQRGYSEEKITDIFQSQQTEDIFRRECSYVVENNGDLQMTYLQIDKRMKSYGFM